MTSPESDRATPDGDRLRSLAKTTLAFTLLLVLIGGLVRVSDSGLGCGPAGSGTEGWPLCGGRLLPLIDTNQMIEYTHRLVAGLVSIAILGLVVLSYRGRRRAGGRAVWRLSAVALTMVVFQAALGGATVENDLHEALVAIHLGTAMLLLAVLLALIRAIGPATAPPAPLVSARTRRTRRLALATCVALLATIVAGGYMAGTQRYGTTGYELGDGAHLACGKEFPSCNGSFAPFGDTRLVDIHLTHRFMMYVAVALLIWLIIAVLRAEPAGRRRVLAIALATITAGQVMVGALNVWLGEHEELILLHLALATALWTLLVSLTLSYAKAHAGVREGAGVTDSTTAS